MNPRSYWLSTVRRFLGLLAWFFEMEPRGCPAEILNQFRAARSSAPGTECIGSSIELNTSPMNADRLSFKTKDPANNRSQK